MNSSSELPWVKDQWPLFSAKKWQQYWAGSQVSRLRAGCCTALGMDMYPRPTEHLPVWSTLWLLSSLRASLCIVSARSARAQLGFILRDGVDKARKKDCGIHPQVKTDGRLPSFL